MSHCLMPVARLGFAAVAALLAPFVGSRLSAQGEVDPSSEAAQSEPDIETLREALLTVQVGERVQVGVLLTPTRCVTGLAALSHGAKIDVRPLGATKVVKAKCVAANAGLDLALLELETPQSKPKTEPDAKADTEAAPSPVEASAPTERFALATDSDVSDLGAGAWTLVFDPRRPQKVEGVPVGEWISEVEDTHVFRAGEHALLRGGMPVVDARGGLIGIWRWSAPGEPAQLVGVEVLRKLAASAPDEGALKLDSQSKARPLVFPLLATPRSSKANATQHAISLAEGLRNKVKCDGCDAKGAWDKEVERKWNGREYVKRMEWYVCKKCAGQRIAPPKKVQGQVLTLAGAVVETAPSDGLRGKLETSLENGLRESAELHPVEFAKRVNDRAREDMVSGDWAAGTPIAFVLPAAHWQRESDSPWGVNVHIVERPPEPRFRHLIFVDPDDRNVAFESCDAFVFGALSGHVKLGEQSYTVLERVVVVPIKSPGDKTGG